MSMLNKAMVVRYIGQDHSFLSVISYNSEKHYREVFEDVSKNLYGKKDVIVFIAKSDKDGHVNFVEILNEFQDEVVSVNMNVRDLLSL